MTLTSLPSGGIRGSILYSATILCTDIIRSILTIIILYTGLHRITGGTGTTEAAMKRDTVPAHAEAVPRQWHPQSITTGVV